MRRNRGNSTVKGENLACVLRAFCEFRAVVCAEPRNEFSQVVTRSRAYRCVCYAHPMIDSELLSVAVHECRSPASVVGGYLRMLQRDSDPPLSERQRRMVDEAERSCARLVAIVAELSDIGKLDAGLVTLARQPLDLFSVVGEVAELVHE